MIVAWLLFPLVLLGVCLGCGLGVERLAGWRVPGALLPSVGLAVVIVVATLTTTRAPTAPFTTAVVVVLAVAGYATSWRRLRRLRPEPWALAVGLGVFVVCAAPVVLSGNATFLGYFVDDDAAIHFALISQLLAHGRDLSNVRSWAYSSISSLLHGYISTSYPTGADVGLGAVRPLVGQDVAWIFQPYLAVILALGAVALHELLRGVVRSPPLRAGCAFIAAQAGLVYAFYLEASIKEIATTWIISVTVVLVVATLRRPLRLRSIAPLAIVAVAGLDVLAIAIVPWLGPPLAVFAVVAGWRVRHAVRRKPSRRTVAATAGVALILVALAAPIISGATTFVSVANAVLTRQGDLGNLAMPLQKWQILGIWPSGDFRLPVEAHYRIAYALMGVALASAALGAVWTVRRRAFGPLLLFVGNGIAGAFLLTRSSPYAASKVMMILSLSAVLAAMLGAAALYEAGRRVEGWVLAGVIAAGVLWTNGLAYHDSSVAPQARFRELAAIGSRFNGQGPAFYNLYDTFAAYFLRGEGAAAPGTWGAAVERSGLPPRTPGQDALAWDPNDLAQSYLQSFRLLVLGRSPTLSRPPANYRLVFQGRYYDVWQRTSTPQVLQHVSLSGGVDPPSTPACRMITQTGALAAREHARLAYVARVSSPTLVPTRAPHPPSWIQTTANGAGDPDVLQLSQQPGAVTGIVHVAQPGRYRVWLEGSLSQGVTVWVGRRLVGSVIHQIGSPGQFLQIGSVDLTAGDQPVQILRPGINLAPGKVLAGYAGTGELLGPLVLVRDSGPAAVRELAPRQSRALCGKPLQWVEIVK
jgi:hypothetical protein